MFDSRGISANFHLCLYICVCKKESNTNAIYICTLKSPFNLHGPNGVLRHLKYLIETKGSAVVCVAEGAGQV